MWLVQYSDEVGEYLKNAGWMALTLHHSIIRLAFTDQGLPTEGEVTDHGDGLYWWIVAGHSLLLRHTTQATRILALYTGELRDETLVAEKIAAHRR